jgi:hypothetical protein
MHPLIILAAIDGRVLLVVAVAAVLAVGRAIIKSDPYGVVSDAERIQRDADQ